MHKRHRGTGYAYTVVIAIFFCVACGASPLQLDSLSSTGQLVAALRQAGATVLQPDIRIQVSYFSGAPSRLTINGGSATSFEYATAEAADRDAALVSPDGFTIGSARISWGDTPKFYKRGRLIVIYVGKSAATTRSLEAVLGRPFAGG